MLIRPAVSRTVLASLERQGFIVKSKKPKKGHGRPSFVYSLPPEIRNQITLTISNPYTTIVSLTFQRLRHICRFEKGDTARKRREDAKPKTAPKSQKKNKNHF